MTNQANKTVFLPILIQLNIALLRLLYVISVYAVSKNNERIFPIIDAQTSDCIHFSFSPMFI